MKKNFLVICAVTLLSLFVMACKPATNPASRQADFEYYGTGKATITIVKDMPCKLFINAGQRPIFVTTIDDCDPKTGLPTIFNTQYPTGETN